MTLRRPAPRRRGRRGLTLIEVLVTVALIVVMFAMVVETIHSAAQFNDLLSARDEVTRGARVTLSRLRREITLAYLTSHVEAANQYRTVFVGEDGDPDTLYLATLAHERLYMDSRESDQAEITVWAEDAPKGVGQGKILYHRESPIIDEEPAEGGTIFPLAYNVRSFSLRYLDGNTTEWTKEWDSRNADNANRLPRAVEIGLVLITVDPDDAERTVDVPFLTTVNLTYATHLKNPTLDAQVAAAKAAAGGITNPFAISQGPGTGLAGMGLSALPHGTPAGGRGGRGGSNTFNRPGSIPSGVPTSNVGGVSGVPIRGGGRGR